MIATTIVLYSRASWYMSVEIMDTFSKTTTRTKFWTTSFKALCSVRIWYWCRNPIWKTKYFQNRGHLPSLLKSRFVQKAFKTNNVIAVNVSKWLQNVYFFTGEHSNKLKSLREQKDTLILRTNVDNNSSLATKKLNYMISKVILSICHT